MRRYPLQRPAALAVAFFSGGLFLAEAGWAACPLAAVAFALAFARGDWCRRALPLFILAFCCGFGWMQHQLQGAHALDAALGAQGRFIVQVVDAPAGGGAFDGKALYFEDGALARPVPLRVQRAWGDRKPLQAGALVAVKGRLRAPEPAHNPGGFDEKKMLHGRGIALVLQGKSAAQLISAPPPWRLQLAAGRAQMDRVLNKGLSADGAALLQGVLFGEKEKLHKDFYALAQQLGIVHVFAVSGLHVGFVLAFLLMCTRFLRCSHHWAVLLPLGLLLAGYVLMTGAHASTVRAAGMAFLALRSHRHRDPWTILAFAAAIILVSHPFALWQVGFQLSFAITAGLIGLLPVVEGWLAGTALPPPLAKGLAVALVAELTSAPFVAYYFHLFTPVSVLVNVCVVPVIGLIVFLSIGAMLISLFVPILTAPAWWPVQALIDLLFLALQGPGRRLAHTHLHVGSPSLLWLLCSLAFLLLLMALPILFNGWRHPLQGIVLGALFLALIFFGHQPAPASLALGVVDVGQGSGAVWQSEAGDWFVFDAGPGADEMAAYLRAAGVNEIAALVLSHGDGDHAHGAAHLLRDFRVRRLFASEVALAGEEGQRLKGYLKDTEVHIVSGPCTVSAGALSLDLVLADRQEVGPNSHQVVALLQEGPWRILFPGDVDGKAFSALPWQGPLDICLAPHHGSRYSWVQGVYERLQPKLVLISCGRDNRFGHPHAELLEGLAALDIPFRRTDEAGGMFLHRSESGLEAVSWRP